MQRHSCPVEQGIAERLPCGAERNGVETRPVASFKHAAHMHFAHLLCELHPMCWKREARLRVALTKRASLIDERHQLIVDTAWRQGAVEQQCRGRARSARARTEPNLEEGRELIEVGPGDGKPGGHGVATALG